MWKTFLDCELVDCVCNFPPRKTYPLLLKIVEFGHLLTYQPLKIKDFHAIVKKVLRVICLYYAFKLNKKTCFDIYM